MRGCCAEPNSVSRSLLDPRRPKGVLFRRRHGWGSRSDEAGPPDGPKPNNNRDNDNPEPKPQAACLLARLHEEIIRPTGRANQGEGRHTTRIPTNSLDSLHTALH